MQGSTAPAEALQTAGVTSAERRYNAISVLAQREGELRQVGLLDRIAPRLKAETDYTVEEKTRSLAMTEDGVAKARSVRELGAAGDRTLIEVVLAEDRPVRLRVR